MEGFRNLSRGFWLSHSLTDMCAGLKSLMVHVGGGLITDLKGLLIPNSNMLDVLEHRCRLKLISEVGLVRSGAASAFHVFRTGCALAAEERETRLLVSQSAGCLVQLNRRTSCGGLVC